MADELSTGELGRRLDTIVTLIQDLVSRREYNEFQRHVEHRFVELEHDIADKRRKHDEDMRDLREEIRDVRHRQDEDGKASGVNFRQAVYSGIVPSIVFAVGALITILLAFKGGK